MKTVKLTVDGEAVRVVMETKAGQAVGEAIIHAVGPSPSLAIWAKPVLVATAAPQPS